MKILTWKDYKEVVQFERQIYCKKGIFDRLMYSRKYFIFRYLRYLRLEEYLINTNRKINKIILFLVKRKKNSLGVQLGFEIGPNTLGKGCVIYHTGCVIINGNSRVGDNFKTAGNICIGDSGGAPTIGDNVTFAFGAMAIGPIKIADNCYVGAGSVVTRSFDEKGSVIVGVPARLLKIEGEQADEYCYNKSTIGK